VLDAKGIYGFSVVSVETEMSRSAHQHSNRGAKHAHIGSVAQESGIVGGTKKRETRQGGGSRSRGCLRLTTFGR
jgi:hypothetical protein